MLKIIITSKLLWLSDLFWEQNAARQRRTRLKTRAIVTWAGFSFIKCRKRIKWKRFLKSSTDRGITLTLTMNISTSIKTHGPKMTELSFRMFLEGKGGGWGVGLVTKRLWCAETGSWQMLKQSFWEREYGNISKRRIWFTRSGYRIVGRTDTCITSKWSIKNTEILLSWNIKNSCVVRTVLRSVHFCCFNYSPGLVQRIILTYNCVAVCRVIAVQSTSGRSEHAESLSGGK